MAKVKMPFIDYSAEESTASVKVSPTITDLQITEIVNAVDGLTLGNRQDAVFVEETDKDAGVAGKSANALAHREVKWLVRGVDNVNAKSVRLELPTADLSLLTGGDDFMVMTDATAAALKAALDAYMLSIDGNPVTINSIEFVGRNI